MKKNNDFIIECSNIYKTYGKGDIATHALQNVNLNISRESFTAIVGASGSGKSTLLNLLGILDRPSRGNYLLDGEDTRLLTKDIDRAKLRRNKIGFVFQQFNLLPKLSALQNVMVPAIYSSLANPTPKAHDLLNRVGLAHRTSHRPNQLSGGEQQRVAIARALINNPDIILADEPTGNLDSTTGKQVIKLLRQLNQEGRTVIVVTHDQKLAANADSQIKLKDGKVVV